MLGKSAKKAIPEEPMLDIGEASLNGTHSIGNKGFFVDHDILPFIKREVDGQNSWKGIEPSSPISSL